MKKLAEEEVLSKKFSRIYVSERSMGSSYLYGGGGKFFSYRLNRETPNNISDW